MWLYLIAVVGYLGILTAVGVWRARRTVPTGEDFLVAGRTLPAHVLVFTLLSTWIGSGSLFGGAGLGYRTGLAALWQSAGAWVGIALIFFIAPRVRRLAQYTVPDILEMRYGPAARVLGTIAIVLSYTAIAAYQFRGGGRLLNLVAGMSPDAGAVTTAAFCIVFTALAGMSSVARLDVINGVTMLAGIGLAIIYLLGGAGGVGAATAALRPEQMTLFGSLSPTQALALFLPTMCLLLGEANMYQKFFSARDERAARLAVGGWIVGTIVVESLIVGIGLLGSLRVPGLGTADSEAIVIRVAVTALPTLLGMMLLAAAAAIIVSTANSMLLSPATNLVRDVYQRFINPAATNRQIVVYMRLVIVGLGILGLVAGSIFPTVLAMALWAYTMYGAGITPALIAALVWPRATREAGIYSIAAGMAVTLGWELAAVARGGIATPSYLLGLQTIYPALIASVGTLVGVTLGRGR
jgi:solute:Na+ symporter, SSS family